MTALLRERGLRVTPQRRAVWAAFDGGRAGHLTADDVLQRARRDLPELARATVYNALNEFVGAGLLATVAGNGSLLYDPNTESHQHFRCRACRRLYDVHPVGTEALGVEEPGFSVESEQIVFAGLCPDCAPRR